MQHLAFPNGLTREDLVAWYRAGRKRTRELFDLLTPAAYYDRPIALRNPIVFYEGHLPAFAINTLIKLALGKPGIDERLEDLFARGIDPEDEASAKSPTDVWPSREEVHAYARAADERIVQALLEEKLEDDAVPQLRGGEAVFTILEHELMHQETLLYLFHNLPHAKKIARAPWNRLSAPASTAATGRGQTVQIPVGRATLGMDRGRAFGWDNEFPRLEVDVDAFTIDIHDVTNGEYVRFVEETGAQPPHFWTGGNGTWLWRGMFAIHPLPLDAPVFVTHDQATAYARWKGKRLPTEAEYHRAAFGTPSGEERLHPWGDEPPDSTRGNFDFVSWEPMPVGSFPAGASAWGVHDLTGNGWEWTSTPFDGFPGFEPMPSYPVYSADFFDRAHYVMKGASQATARELVRGSFRNWFRPNYPFMYATFRMVG